MTEKERMLSGKLYKAQDKELAQMYDKSRILQHRFNNSLDREERKHILKELLGKTGTNYYMEPPIYFDYGSNIYLGENFYANFDLLILDVNKVTIGDNVMIGPRVSILTAGHPIVKEIRNTGLEFGYPITIGNDVWIGGNVTINPGVTIGDNVVIGSGSVVTKDIPSGVVACGNPCKVLRKITKEDLDYWQKQADEYYIDKQKSA